MGSPHQSSGSGPWLAERGVLAGLDIEVLEICDPGPVLGKSQEAQHCRHLAHAMAPA
ncbi:hypothetical protein [Streptomyces griseorubiginosus]|uniref:hypothetical protein n=1 Tax=Streptomyces griseorubiginosus TaxID=67304 RepID=UPI0036CC5C62